MVFRRKIWISGSKGRIGSELVNLINPIDYEVLETDIDEVDITNSKDVNIYVDINRPNIIINSSGYTDALKCEENIEQAFNVNSIGAKNLAIAANRINAKIIHLSTDDIFSGGNTPYREYDEAKPQTVFGKSKLLGEEYVKQFSNTYFILRSSWLYGRGNLMVEKIIKEAKENGKVKVAANQVASPTSSIELAKFIYTIIDSHEYGTYHTACQGECSRKEFAEKILELAKINAEVEEIVDLKGFQNRPEYSVLDNFILKISKLYEFPKWETALENYIKGVKI